MDTAIPTPGVKTDTLLTTLIEQGQLSSHDLERVELFAAQSGRHVVRAIAELGIMQERTFATFLCETLGLKLATLDDYPAAPVLDPPTNPDLLRRRGVFPLELTAEKLTLAVLDPFDTDIIRSFRLLTGKPTELRVAIASELDSAIDRISAPVADIPETAGAAVLSDRETQRLRDLASEAPIVRLVDLLISRAVEAHASDIHVECREHSVQVRFRIDGVLCDQERISAQQAPALFSRLKIISNLDIAERRLPQDGRIKHVVHGKLLDFRTSIVPTLHGERAVIRILDPENAPKALTDTGMSAFAHRSVTSILSRPHGMFLVTGPTGSGKTTTLYSALRGLPSDRKNILTVEDPIEYQLAGPSQIQVKPQIGLTFAEILRSVLRQDPDIIMVGEIRDPETAELAVQAALTGHLVLSTLHTNSSIGAFPRLIDMGVPDYLVVSSIEGVLSQRLVRRLCPDCKKPKPAGEIISERLRKYRPDISTETTLYAARGCKACRDTGYRGRLALTEVLIPNEPFRQGVLKRLSTQELSSMLGSAHYQPLLVDGVDKVLNGLTTLEEVSAQAMAEIA